MMSGKHLCDIAFDKFVDVGLCAPRDPPLDIPCQDPQVRKKGSVQVGLTRPPARKSLADATVPSKVSGVLEVLFKLAARRFPKGVRMLF